MNEKRTAERMAQELEEMFSSSPIEKDENKNEVAEAINSLSLVIAITGLAIVIAL